MVSARMTHAALRQISMRCFEKLLVAGYWMLDECNHLSSHPPTNTRQLFSVNIQQAAVCEDGHEGAHGLLGEGGAAEAFAAIAVLLDK